MALDDILVHFSGRVFSFLTRGKLRGKQHGQWFGTREGMGSLVLVTRKTRGKMGCYRSRSDLEVGRGEVVALVTNGWMDNPDRLCASASSGHDTAGVGVVLEFPSQTLTEHLPCSRFCPRHQRYSEEWCP